MIWNPTPLPGISGAGRTPRPEPVWRLSEAGPRLAVTCWLPRIFSSLAMLTRSSVRRLSIISVTAPWWGPSSPGPSSSPSATSTRPSGQLIFMTRKRKRGCNAHYDKLPITDWLMMTRGCRRPPLLLKFVPQVRPARPGETSQLRGADHLRVAGPGDGIFLRHSGRDGSQIFRWISA